jgi:haloalkane dehalogenase
MDRRKFVLTTLALAGGAGMDLQTALAGKRQTETDAAVFAAERRFAALRQGKIAYVDRGSGPAAVFLHGFPLNGYQWRGALDRLSMHRRCIVPDFMGLGYTEPSTGQDFRAPAQAAMVVTLLDKLGIRDVDVVANDSGCAVAQLLLAHHPRRVRTLLLTNGDTEPNCPPSALQGVIAAAKAGTFSASFQPLIDDKEMCRRPDRLGGAFTFPQRLRDETIDMYLKPLAADADRINAFGRAVEGNPLSGIAAALSKTRVPVRIVWGEGDTIFNRDMAGYLDNIFPQSRGVRRLPDARLFFPEEYPDVIADELRRLWNV